MPRPTPAHAMPLLRSVIKDLHAFVRTLTCEIRNPSKSNCLLSSDGVCERTGAIPFPLGFRRVRQPRFFLASCHHSDCNEAFGSGASQ